MWHLILLLCLLADCNAPLWLAIEWNSARFQACKMRKPCAFSLKSSSSLDFKILWRINNCERDSSRNNLISFSKQINRPNLEQNTSDFQTIFYRNLHIFNIASLTKCHFRSLLMIANRECLSTIKLCVAHACDRFRYNEIFEQQLTC